MKRSILPALLTFIVLIFVMACGPPPGPDGGDTRSRTKEGIGIWLSGRDPVEVGAPSHFAAYLENQSPQFRPEDPFTIRQETGELIAAGPITLDEYEAYVLPMEPGKRRAAGFEVTCTAVGSASVTYQSKGQSGVTSPESAYSITVEFQLECVADNRPRNPPGYDDLTNNALGFSENSLTWVTSNENSILLRISQIEPVRMEVGDSVEIYSDFDAKDTVDVRDRELRDAKLEFTIGGPIRIDSPPDRQSDLVTGDSELFRGNQAIFWGFRSGTLTCLSEGEGVYSSKLTGFLANGGTITQTVSGVVDCEEPPVLDALPMLGQVYTIDGRSYERVQFQYQEGHDGCGLPHVHSNVTVYPYLEWFIRGFPDMPLQKTGDAPLTDPDPDGCGFGTDISLKNPPSVFVPVQHVLELCDRIELDRIEPSSDLHARNLSNFIEVCDTLRN